MPTNQETPKIPLPKGWKQHVRSAVLHVISLAQYTTVYTRGWAADSTNSRVRLKAELDRVNQEIALLREEAPKEIVKALSRGEQVAEEVGLRMRCEIPFAKAGRRVAAGLENLGDGNFIAVQNRVDLLGVSALSDPHWITARHQRRRRRTANRLSVEARKPHPFRRHPIKVQSPNIV